MNDGKRSLNLFFSKNNFIGSFNAVDLIPNNNVPECCFVGRSNVGKSTIINAITKSKKLAKTSKTPGRTQSINLFKINDIINIADMPGYGYAKISKIKREELSNLIETYIVNRNNLLQVFVLIDCKVGVKDVDIDIFDSISTADKKFSIILTKSDKAFLLTVPLAVENIMFKFSQEVLSSGKGKTAVIFSSLVNGKIPIIGLPLALGANSGSLKTFI